MREELEEIKRKLGEAQRQIIEQQHGDAELELAVQILEKSLTDLDGPTAGMLALFLRLYRHEREPKKLIDRLNVAQQILMLVDELIDDLQNKKPTSFSEADGKPDEVKKVVETELKKEPKARRKSHIKGKHIVNALAQQVERDYGTKLTNERYLQVLEAISVQPKATYFKIIKATGLSKNAVYSHIRYGQKNGDIENKKGIYSLRKNGTATWNSLKSEYGDKVEPIGKSDRARVEGEYLTDEKAVHIHKTMATPVIKERYEKTLNILENHFGKKAKVSEIKSLTGWSENNTKAQIQYGILMGAVVHCGKHDGEKQFCLTKHLEDVTPKKETKVAYP